MARRLLGVCYHAGAKKLRRSTFVGAGLLAAGWLMAQDHPASNISLTLARSLDGLACKAPPHQRMKLFVGLSHLSQRAALEGPIVNAFLLDSLCREAARIGVSANAPADNNTDASLLERMHHLTLSLDPYCADAPRVRALYCRVSDYLSAAVRRQSFTSATLHPASSNSLLFYHLLLLATCRVQWLVEMESCNKVPALLPASLAPDESFVAVWGRRALRRVSSGLTRSFSDVKENDRLCAERNAALASALANEAARQLRATWARVLPLVRHSNAWLAVEEEEADGDASCPRRAAIAANCRFLSTQAKNVPGVLYPRNATWQRAVPQPCSSWWWWWSGLPLLAGVALGSGAFVQALRTGMERRSGLRRPEQATTLIDRCSYS